LEFRVLFGDRVQRAFFNNGPLSTAANVARYQQITQELQQAIVAESARWGDMHRSTPYTRTDWQGEINNVITYLNARNNVLLTQLRNAGLFSNVVAPAFSHFGGMVAPGFDLSLSAPAGAIWYTLDGSDPRMIGGVIRPGALQYTGSPVDIPVGLTVNARALNGGVWSALSQATFTVAAPADATNLRFSELHYNPASQAGVSEAQTLEFIELVNPSGQMVSLDGVQVTQFANDPYIFPNGLTLAPGQRIVVGRNPTVLQALYGPGINLAPTGYAEANLSNGGEPIALVGALGQMIQNFSYSDLAPWPTSAEARNRGIVNPLGDASSPALARQSFYGGSPGTSGDPPAEQGDFNGDALVDGADLLLWQRGLGRLALTAGAPDGDADGDRDVDGQDLALWTSNFGAVPVTAAAAVANASPTPNLNVAWVAQRPIDRNDAATRKASLRQSFRPSSLRLLATEVSGRRT
jgi:hypothetical protein